jgi:hypothetical protein
LRAQRKAEKEALLAELLDLREEVARLRRRNEQLEMERLHA